MLTSDGANYYHNSKTGALSWDMPAELEAAQADDKSQGQWVWVQVRERRVYVCSAGTVCKNVYCVCVCVYVWWTHAYKQSKSLYISSSLCILCVQDEEHGYVAAQSVGGGKYQLSNGTKRSLKRGETALPLSLASLHASQAQEDLILLNTLDEGMILVVTLRHGITQM
jgi:hypothetical protein